MSIADESGKVFKAEMREGKPKMGLFLNSSSPTVAEQLSTAGTDQQDEVYCARKKYHRDRLAKAHNSQTDSVFQLWHPRQPEINGDRQTVTEGTGLRAFSSGPG